MGCVQLLATLWTVAHQASLSMRFSRQEYYWSGLLCPPPGDLPDRGIQPESLMFPALADGFFITSATWEAMCVFSRYWEMKYTELPQEVLAYKLYQIWSLLGSSSNKSASSGVDRFIHSNLRTSKQLSWTHKNSLSNSDKNYWRGQGTGAPSFRKLHWTLYSTSHPPSFIKISYNLTLIR